MTYCFFDAVPEGWMVEQGDPSVGIFGYDVWHEGCPNFSDELVDESLATDSEFVVGLTFVPREWGVEVVTRTRFTCPLCGEHADFRNTDLSSFSDENIEP